MVCISAGRSAARLARVLREHEVGGSNPLAPICYLMGQWGQVN